MANVYFIRAKRPPYLIIHACFGSRVEPDTDLSYSYQYIMGILVRSCTQTGLKRKPLRIGRSCARLRKINSVSVDPEQYVSFRKERPYRKQ